MAFRVGQKVERIGGTTRTGYAIPPMHVPFTVSRRYLAPDGDEVIDLAEFPSPETEEYLSGFAARFFRPIVSTESGMALLESIRRDVSNHILRPVREDA